MDYFDGGDLQGVIDICKENHTKIHPLIALMWSIEIVKGTKICHENDIIHRDLRPENVLVKSPYIVNDYLWAVTNQTDLPRPLAVRVIERLPEFIEQMKSEDWHWCCVADFGLLKLMQGVDDNVHISGATEVLSRKGYVAPELINPGGTYSIKSDIFTVGGLLYNLFTGEHPFPTSFYTNKYKRMNNILYPANIHAIVTQCLQENPRNRPTIEEVEKEMAEGFSEVLRQFEFLSDSFIGQWIPARSTGSVDSDSADALVVVSRWPTWKADELGLLTLELFEAISKGRIADAKELLSRGVSPMSRDVENQTPLHLAVISGNLEVVRLLFEYSIDINAEGKSKKVALHLAAQANNTALLEFLIHRHAYVEAIDEDLATPLITAAIYGSVKAIDTLLQRRAKINHYSKDSKQALHYAALKNRPLAVTCLLDWSADIEARTSTGETPLICAAKEGSLGTVKALTLRGANVEARCSSDNAALHMATSHGSLHVVRHLLEAGAKPTAKGQFERQAIHFAATKNHRDVAAYLIQNNPECVLALDEDHATPLHAAADANHVNMAKLLLSHGASPSAKTGNAKTPRDMTLGVVHWGMRKVLKEAEAKEKVNRTKTAKAAEGITASLEVLEIKV